jgi:hypothetical protein
LKRDDSSKYYSISACQAALRDCINNFADAKHFLKNNYSKAGFVGGTKAQSESFPGCFERVDEKSIHIQTFEVFEHSSSLTDLPSHLWDAYHQYMRTASNGSVPPSSIIEETSTVRVHRAVCARKSETTTYIIREWLKAEEIPTREHFFASRSKELLNNVLKKNENALKIAGKAFCDCGLHGLENLLALNHPQVRFSKF